MKESVRIFRFIVIGTMNALIMALVVWLMMREMSFEGDYMVANVTAYIIAQIHNFIWCKYWIFPVEKERTMSGNRYYSSVLLSGLLTLRSFYSLFVGRRSGCQ